MRANNLTVSRFHLHVVVAPALMCAALGSTIAAADVAVYAKAGTLGYGGGVGINLTDSIRLRGEYTAASFSPSDIDTDDVTYDPDLDLKSGGLMLDWHPFHGTFRLTAGLLANGNELKVNGEPTSGSTYTINGQTYTASQIGTLKGKVDFNSTAPYLGIGWGDALDKNGHFTFMADIGVMFQGSGNVKLQASCGSAVTPTQCAQIGANVAAEEKDLEDEISDYKYWPVLSVGLGYRF
jgi:hypothetical protein